MAAKIAKAVVGGLNGAVSVPSEQCGPSVPREGPEGDQSLGEAEHRAGGRRIAAPPLLKGPSDQVTGPGSSEVRKLAPVNPPDADMYWNTSNAQT